MRFIGPYRLVRFGIWLWLSTLVGNSSSFVAFSQEVTNARLLSLSELNLKTLGSPQKEFGCRSEGFVRAIVPERNLVAVQDSSDVILFELPRINSTIRVGDKIVIEAAHCLFSQTRFGIRVDDIPIVDNDGLHTPIEKSGGIFLKTGMNPIRVDWFNGPAEFVLNLDFEGPDFQRQHIPNSRLWHTVGRKKDDHQNLEPGLDYRAYEGVDWAELPDFGLLTPAAAGIASNFSTIYRTRDEYCGLNFKGFIQIERPGLYKFYLKSDDGSRLCVGESAVICKTVKAEGTSLPVPESFERALADHNKNHWIQMEGEVTFASQDQRALNLEMLVGGNRVPVRVDEGSERITTNLLRRWIQVQGLCKFSGDARERRLVGVFVPGIELMKMVNFTRNVQSNSAGALLTTITEVRHLTTAEAGRRLPVKVQGVVIFAGPAAIVLQDSSDGVFISCRGGYWKLQPEIGEVWEIEGSTDSGLFSPVIIADNATFIGYAPLPEPIHPTRDQLINGNMDAEYGELHGFITSVSSNEIVLLTPDGKVSVMGSSERPLPELPKSFPGDSPVGSVVRIRGCFAPMVDVQTRQVISGKTYLYPALVEVEDPVPQEPFLLPTRTPADLMWFNARAVALERTKLAGQVLCSLPGECFVFDGKNGFRVLTKDSSTKSGDLIEAVGFPNLDGPSPVLQEAQIRKTGHAPLPSPAIVAPEKLLERGLDSTLIEVTALLIRDTVRRGERVLELQSGPQLFVARVESVPKAVVPLSVGCRLRLIGVYARASDNQDQIGIRVSPFELLLNSSADIVVLQRPPWWTIQRVIIVLVVVLALLSVMFFWVGLLRRKVEQRTAQLKKEIEQRQFVEQRHAIELERTRVARDLHDELGAGLTEVGLLGSLANTPAVDADSRNRYMNQITQMARSLVTSLDEIVWAVNPHYDSVASLVSYFSLYAESFLNLAGVNCRLRVPKNVPDSPLDSKQRHGVFCVFKETLNNVIRHSTATEVQIIFEATAGDLSLSVIDNGCGFEFVSDSPGKDGLASVRQRMQELGGSCQISSRPRHATTVKISLPLNQN